MKVLFLPYSHQLGTTNGLVHLAEDFRKHGAEAIFAGEGKYLDYARRGGFKVVPLIEHSYDTHRAKIDKGSAQFHTEEEVRQFIEEELKLYDRLKPDLIISQVRPTAPISAKIADIKHISVSISFGTGHYALKTPVPESFSYYFLTKIPILGNLINNNTYKLIKFKLTLEAKPYKKVAQEYGVNSVKSMLDLMNGNMMTLVAEEPSMFPLDDKQPKDKFTFTGPLLRHTLYDTPDWYDQTKQTDGDFIYLSMGSSSKALYPKVYERIKNIFANKDGVYVITNTLDLVDTEKAKKKAPSNFFIVDTAPAKIMLELADVTVTHGGKGTIYHSIMNGVPVLGIPIQGEQETNLRRMKDLGVGDYILAQNLDKISDRELEERIMNIIHSKKILDKTLKLGDKVRKTMDNVDNIVKDIISKVE